jgi:hypothetical protein
MYDTETDRFMYVVKSMHACAQKYVYLYFGRLDMNFLCHLYGIFSTPITYSAT